MDMFLLGNLGLKTLEECLQDTIEKNEDAVYLVPEDMDGQYQYPQEALKELAGFREVNLYLRGMVPLVGFKSTTVEYSRKKRMEGKTHYSLGKMLSLAFNGITSLSVRPLKMIAGLGFILALLSLIGIIWAVAEAFMGNTAAGWASLVCIVCFLSGIQLLCLGVIGEYVGKIYMETKRRPRYIISERTYETREGGEN